MALDVGIRDADNGIRPAPRAILDNDGYYWFLHPLMDRLRLSHGRYIDLYGDVEFRVGELSLLYNLLDEAETMVRARPERWQVHMGTVVLPTTRELYADVEQGAFLRLIAQLRDIVAAAEDAGAGVLFLGD